MSTTADPSDDKRCYLKMTAWGLEKRMVRAQAAATIPRARLLCAAQFSDSSGDWTEISLEEKRKSDVDSLIKEITRRTKKCVT